MMNWKDITVHDDKCVMGFFREYRFLSNFYPCLIEYEGAMYPSTENAYMAAKCPTDTLRVVFRTIAPRAAKQKGREVPLREDWENVKFDIMYQLVHYKFTNNLDLRDRLLATGEKYLEETNYWGDKIWGVCKNEGENHMGKILMRVRKELRDDFRSNTEVRSGSYLGW